VTLDSGDATSSTPSSLALTGDGRLAFVGYADSCRLCVFDVDEDEVAFDGRCGCRRLASFDYRKVIGVSVNGCEKQSTTYPVVEEVRRLTVSPTDNVRVLMNISGRYLIVYDASIDVGTQMDVTSLR
jgi:hypothetical protein